MRSSCPHCLSLTEHAHDESQVTCSSCGQNFSPFLTDSDSAQVPEFSESSLAFQEIVSFGEALGNEAVASGETHPSLSSDSSEVPQTEKPIVAPSSIQKDAASPDILLSTTSSLPFSAPHQTLPPISLMVLMGEDHAPLENGFKALTDLAKQLDADGIIGIRCSLSPDNRRALIIGTPIRWEKK